MSLKNPFETEENLKPWFELDIKYQLSKKTAKTAFAEVSNYSPNFFMSFKHNLFHFFAKQAILSILIFLLLITTIGAAALEAVAPKEYKPSEVYQKLFSTNRQKDKDPYTALAPDGENNVVIADKCDLAIKYPSKVENTFVSAFSAKNTDLENYSLFNPQTKKTIKPLDVVDLKPNVFFNKTESEVITMYKQNREEFEKLTSQPFYNINITCFDLKEYRDLEVSSIISSEIDFAGRLKLKSTELKVAAGGNFVPKKQEKTPLSKTEFAQLTGWFITQADVKNIYKIRIDERTQMLDQLKESRKRQYESIKQFCMNINDPKFQVFIAENEKDYDNLYQQKKKDVPDEENLLIITKDQKQECENQSYNQFLDESDFPTDFPIYTSPEEKYKQFIEFEFQDKLYQINFTSKKLTENDLNEEQKSIIKNNPNHELYKYFQIEGLYGNQIQLQFNSLVKNLPNKALEEEKGYLATFNP